MLNLMAFGHEPLFVHFQNYLSCDDDQITSITQAFYFDCLPRRLRTVVYVSSMEAVGCAVSSDRGERAHCVAVASGTPSAYATSCRTETPRARSWRCPGESVVRSSQGAIFFPRSVSRTRNHVASNESVCCCCQPVQVR